MGYKNLFSIDAVDGLWEEIRSLRQGECRNADRVLKNLVQGVSLDQPIYRIMSLSRFRDSVQRTRLAFVYPSKWDDPIEASLLYGMQLRHHDEDLACSYEYAIVGQCWSLEKECDGLWRVYSNHANQGPVRTCYVQVQTTVRNLMLSILCQREQEENSGILLGGAVVYKPTEAIMSQIRTLEVSGFYEHANGISAKPHEVAEAYFVKRASFAYEKEVRFVFIRGRYLEEDRFEIRHDSVYGGMLDLAYNPKCIERVVIDPWTSCSDDAETLRREIAAEVPLAKVELSDLYQKYIGRRGV